MKVLVVATFLTVLAGPALSTPVDWVPRAVKAPVAGRAGGALRLTGGGEANPFQFPWQAALLTTAKQFFCGGSVISEQWILTAGHCVDPFTEFVVVLGGVKLPDSKSHLESSRQTFTTQARHLHPQYDMMFLDNDVGLLMLPTPIKETLFVTPVALPPYSHAMVDLTGKTARISGWGKTDDDSGASRVLKFTTLEILPNAECSNVYGNTVIGNKLCLSAKNGDSVCQGDSGGALVVQGVNETVQIGITSFVSIEGCTVTLPQGFTRVDSFLGYIEETTGIAISD